MLVSVLAREKLRDRMVAYEGTFAMVRRRGLVAVRGADGEERSRFTGEPLRP